MERWSEALSSRGTKLSFGVKQFRDAKLVGGCRAEWTPSEDAQSLPAPNGTVWQVTASGEALQGPYGGCEIATEWLHSGESDEEAVEVGFAFEEWSPRTYVLVPGAIYGGNRFEARKLSYAPCWSILKERGPDTPALITDVPRLNAGPGASGFHLLAGDEATPAFGFYNPERKRAVLILHDAAVDVGQLSIHVEESLNRKRASVSFRAPGVRPEKKYGMCTTEDPSPDRGASFHDGDRLKLRFRYYSFGCESAAGLFEAFVQVRKALTGEQTLAPMIPMSEIWSIGEDKYNAMNWNEEFGYYRVGTVNEKHQDWQLGWVGGGIASYALLLAGHSVSAERAKRNIDFIFSGQTKAGFFPGVFFNGQWYGDEFGDDPNRDAPEGWHIVRKSADALYFLVKQFIAFQDRFPLAALPERWLDGTRELADAFIKLWLDYGQFGQWIDARTGRMLVGGSAGGAMAVGGLALLGRFVSSETFVAYAREAGDYYYNQFTSEGITTGGPGEILQCPDSESAFALLESFVVLYEVTGDSLWLKRSEEAAAQALSWCVTYPFEFPESSTFGKLGMQTVGSVIANVQNKHSAPGICTFSGDSLLRLFRATGNRLYLDQLRETAHGLPQYLSREDRPIRGWDGKDMPAGYMSERVNMSDWEGQELVGEALPLSCWCEVSAMLTRAEVPSIYLQPDTGFLWVSDHVACRLKQDKNGLVEGLVIANPTAFPANVHVMAELSAEAAVPLASGSMARWPRFTIAAGEEREIACAELMRAVAG